MFHPVAVGRVMLRHQPLECIPRHAGQRVGVAELDLPVSHGSAYWSFSAAATGGLSFHSAMTSRPVGAPWTTAGFAGAPSTGLGREVRLESTEGSDANVLCCVAVGTDASRSFAICAC